MQTEKLYWLQDKGSLLVTSILFINLLSCCTFTISCSSYIPTLSYLASFRTHDCAAMVAYSIEAFLLFTLFIGFHHSLKADLKTEDSLFMKTLELCIVVLTLMEGLIDESAGIDFNPVDDVHRFITIALVFAGFAWTYWALTFLADNKLDGMQQIHIQISWTLYWVELFLVGVTMVQWHLAYTIYNNMLFNQIAESIFEWISVVIAVRMPYHISRAMDTSLKVVVRDKDKN